MADRKAEDWKLVLTWGTAFRVWFALAAVALVVFFVSKTLWALALTVASAMIAVALDHVVDLLVQHRWKRHWAILTVFLAAVAILIGFFLIIIPPAVRQAEQLIDQAPKAWADFRHTELFASLERRFSVKERVEEFEHDFGHVAQGAVAPVLAVIGGVLQGVGGMVTVLFLVLFMLIFGGRLIQVALKEIFPEQVTQYARVLKKIYTSVGGYLGGLILVCTLNFSLTTLWLGIVTHTAFFLPLGLVSGISSMVPYAGPVVMGTGITLIVLVTSGIIKGLLTALYFIVYGQLEGNIFSPLIFRKTVHINPLVTLLSILFLAEFAGVFGAILAVPVVAAAQIIVREVLSLRDEPVESHNS